DGVPAAMVSASHNPYGDNGIKLFAAGGLKLSDEVEAELEAELDRLLHGAGTTAGEVATIALAAGATDGYVEFLLGAIEPLNGLRIVLDCANGAASTVGPEVLRRAGAEVDVIHADPNGTNINEACGATHVDSLQRRVVELGF